MRNNQKSALKLSLITLALSTISACSNGVPRKPVNELPSHIEVVHINFSNGAWKLRLTHRQKENRINSKLSCDISTDQNNSLAFNWVDLPELSYQLTETIDIPSVPKQLNTANLPNQMNYQLTCELMSDNFRTETIRKNSVLHRVPGQQAKYR